MKNELEYEAPKLLELETSLFQGKGGVYDNVSNAKFESVFYEEDAEHEVIELQ